ncbi:MAG: HAD-IA family hydrolase [Dehalococcoidia bacterium]|nr:HAD-IA family hydrolase [Dehalococcoidia bacterium]MDZ4278351.1 HAD-IA family hydrolase [Dehalococcoidia bacterium]
MPIRGLVFDFGGVINNMRWDVSAALEEEHGLERGALVRTFYDNDEWREVQEGRGDSALWLAASHRRLEEIAGRSLPPLHDRWRESWHPIKENIELIRALRPSYQMAILSNADRNLEERMRDGMAIHDLFDTVVVSGAVGVAKPDPRIYALAAERLGLPAESCLFIDDSKRNVEAAREVGMAAVHFRIHRGDRLAEQLAEHGVRPHRTR